MKEIFDKSTWTKTTFGEVCRNLNITEHNPIQKGITRLVGLEHIEPESLHIRQWGNIEDGTTFTKVFHPGHVLFGKRRAYLRKAAVADFSGICSGDILVFEAIEDAIHPRLLPFLVSSERFFSHAIKTSAGSLSPRTKFQDLANFEFLLPPMDQQEKLAELLWAGDGAIEKYQKLLHSIDVQANTFLNTTTSTIKKISKLGDIGKFIKGKGIPKSEVRDRGVPCVRYGELYTTHKFVLRTPKSFIEQSSTQSSLRLSKGDVLFAGSGETIEDIGASISIINDNEVYAGSDIIVFRPSVEINPFYLGYITNSNFARNQIKRLGKGATVAHIYADDLKSVQVPFPERLNQDRIVNRLEKLHEEKTRLANILKSTTSLLNGLTANIFKQ
jgi:type I restriction enzyme, S subunit